MDLCKSFSDTPQKGITGLQGKNIYYFSNISLQNSCNHLYFHQQVMKIPIYPMCCTSFGIHVLILVIQMEKSGYLIDILICIFLITIEFKYLFVYMLAISPL